MPAARSTPKSRSTSSPFAALTGEHGPIHVRASEVVSVVAMPDGKTLIAFNNTKNVIVEEAVDDTMKALNAAKG